jgi:two-component system, sensor histidine kinase and response regulator
MAKNEKRNAAEAASIDNSQRYTGASNGSRGMLQNVLDTIPVRVFWKDRNGVYLGCNQLFARDAGKRSPEEIVGKTDFDMGWREQAELYRRDDKEVITSGQPKIDFEEPQTTPAGDIIWLKTSKIPLHAADGSVYGVLGTYEDITERKKTELALQESEEKFRHLAENIQAVFWLKEGDELVYLSPAYEQIWGRSLKEFTRHDTFLDAVVPEDMDSVRAAFSEYLVTGEFNEQFRIRRPDGEIRWIHSRSFPFCIEEECSRSAGIAQDITERKRAEEALQESEQKFRAVFEGAAESIYLQDFKGRFLDVNRKGHELLGYTREELLRMSPLDLDEQVDMVQDRIQTILREGSLSFETILTRKDGTRLPAEVNSQLITYGEQPAILAVVRDITERKQTEKKLKNVANELEDRVRERTLELEQANQAKNKFLANMSHEIRTPLSGILGLAELSLDVSEPDVLHDNVEMIRSSALSLNTIINDLLDFSAIEAGRLNIRPLEFSIREELARLIDGFQEQAALKGLAFEFHIADEVPERVVTDPARVRQILINLLNNAIKFTLKGKITFIVQCPDPDHLTFSVADTGIGIPENRIKDIFQSFTQLEATVNKRFGGTGLGLAISKNLAELMGGSIEVKSKEGVGSVFKLLIPVEIPEEEETPHEAKPARSELRPLRILLAEDNPVNQLVMQRLLTKQGHSVHAASDGRQALEELKNSVFDLVLMDVQMPEVNGLDATRAIREGASGKNPVTIPIIALTAYAMKGDRERFMAAGMDGYVTKPVDVDELTRAIREVST